MARPAAERNRHRNEITRACQTERRDKLLANVVVVARQTADRRSRCNYTDGIQTGPQCDFLAVPFSSSVNVLATIWPFIEILRSLVYYL